MELYGAIRPCSRAGAAAVDGARRSLGHRVAALGLRPRASDLLGAPRPGGFPGRMQVSNGGVWKKSKVYGMNRACLCMVYHYISLL